MYILAPKMYILSHKMYILAPQMYILAPKMDKSLSFEKVQPQWQLLYLFFWECGCIGSQDPAAVSTRAWAHPIGEVNHREGITHTNTSTHMLGSHSQEMHTLTEDTSEKGTRDHFWWYIQTKWNDVLSAVNQLNMTMKAQERWFGGKLYVFIVGMLLFLNRGVEKHRKQI